MKKILLLLLSAALLLTALVLLLRRPEEPRGVMAYVSGDTRLYRDPADPEPFATIPSGTRVRWLSTTPDYAFGCIEAPVDGKTVRAYAPWLSLNITNDGTESDQAMEALRTALGWSEEDISAYDMHTPATYMRCQFVNVEVRSRTHPAIVYYIWLDKLNGGLHDIQTPFTGAWQNAEEKVIRETLRSGQLTSAGEVKAHFISWYGPEESWSPALREWVEAETARFP